MKQQQQKVADGLRQGNQQAWRMFYDAHAERVWRLVTRQMSTSCDVADVVQETFLAGAKSAAKYDPSRGTLWNWISGIARNQVALHYRKQQRQQPLKQSDDGSSGNREAVIDWLESREASPPEALASVELVSLIRTTLTELPINYEELLTAKYIEGASVQQIAIAEDCGQETIRSRLARARRAFRQAFTQSSNYSTVEGSEHDES